MPPLTAELAGVAAVILGLLLVAIAVDPTVRATRKANASRRVARHTAAGCAVCTEKAAADVDAWLDYPQAGTRRPAGGKGARR